MFSSSFAAHVPVASLRPAGAACVLKHLQSLQPYRNMASDTVKSNINFNTKHLKNGDSLPPYNGKLRVYNMRYCPFAQRTILALNAKKLDYEVININLLDKPDWLFIKSGLGKVPALEIKENVSIYESLVTVEYLDEVYPEIRLLPVDPVRKAFDKILIEATAPFQTLFVKQIKVPEAITEDNIKNFAKALDLVQNELIARGTPFLHGKEPGYVDYMIWPWFERIVAMGDKFPTMKVDEKQYQPLLTYINKMMEDPAVNQYLVPKEVLLEVLDGYTPGKTPNYDILCTDSSK